MISRDCDRLLIDSIKIDIRFWSSDFKKSGKRVFIIDLKELG
jgi:hypothetical protein